MVHGEFSSKARFSSSASRKAANSGHSPTTLFPQSRPGKRPGNGIVGWGTGVTLVTSFNGAIGVMDFEGRPVGRETQTAFEAVTNAVSDLYKQLSRAGR